MTAPATDRARAFLEAVRPAIDAALDARLPAADEGAPRLAEAMRYSVFAGGKRLRAASYSRRSVVLWWSRGSFASTVPSARPTRQGRRTSSSGEAATPSSPLALSSRRTRIRRGSSVAATER